MVLKRLHRTTSEIKLRAKHQWLAAKTNPSIALLVLAELLLALTLVTGLFVFVSPDIDLIPAPWNRLLFWADISALLVGLVFILYLISNRRFVKETAIQKLRIAKQETRIPALLALEFFLAMVVVLATFIYLDPEYNLVPWPLNVFFFLAVLGITAYLYAFSSGFRRQSRAFFSIRKRW